MAEERLIPEILIKDETITISFKIKDECASFYFSEIEHKKNREIDVTLTVVSLIPGLAPYYFDGRLNILSLSGRYNYARQLNKILKEKDPSWDLMLDQACFYLREELSKQKKERPIEEFNAETNKIYLFEPFLVESAPNLLFGKGGSGKTYLAIRLALSIITGKPFFNQTAAHPTKVLFIDYESSGSSINQRFWRTCGDLPEVNLEELMGKFFYFNPKGTPFSDCLLELKKIIVKNEIGLIIVDSGALACGGEPEKAESALNYFNALASLKITSLTIAHETKEEKKSYPFGSIFWFNSPRNIWNAQAESEQEEDSIHGGLFHRKSNEDKRKKPITYRIDFNPGQTCFTLEESDYWEKEQSIPVRICKLLKEKPKNLDELCLLLPETTRGNVKKTLSQLKLKKRVLDSDHSWYLTDEAHQNDDDPQGNP